MFADLTSITTLSGTWFGSVGSEETYVCNHNFGPGVAVTAAFYTNDGTLLSSAYPNVNIGNYALPAMIHVIILVMIIVMLSYFLFSTYFQQHYSLNTFQTTFFRASLFTLTATHLTMIHVCITFGLVLGCLII